jgi:hypothetical protein
MTTATDIFTPFEHAAIAASAGEVVRQARRGIRPGGDGLTPIRDLYRRYGPMIYDPEAIAAVAGVHVDLVCAMARLGYLNICDGWVVTVKGL